MMNEAARVRNWLQRCWHVIVPDDWLDACLEWIHQENDGMPLSVEDLNSMVYEQWLLSDLREIGAMCLPANIAQEAKYYLEGHYCLQVDSLVDVSTPYYSQLQKIQGTENANVNVSATQATQSNWEPKASRMLMLKLTDGTQDVQGMEYQSIPCLNTNLNPGTKVSVSGKILCRLGVLMLTRNNVKVLGGEVESLFETHTQQQLLEASLKQNSAAAGENPPMEECAEFKTSVVKKRESKKSTSTTRATSNVQSERVMQNDQINPTNSVQNSSLEFPDDDDDFLDNLDASQLDAMEQGWSDDMDYDVIMEQLDSNIPSTSYTSYPPPAKKHHLSTPSSNPPRDSHTNRLVMTSQDSAFDSSHYTKTTRNLTEQIPVNSAEESFINITQPSLRPVNSSGSKLSNTKNKSNSKQQRLDTFLGSAKKILTAAGNIDKSVNSCSSQLLVNVSASSKGKTTNSKLSNPLPLSTKPCHSNKSRVSEAAIFLDLTDDEGDHSSHWMPPASGKNNALLHRDQSKKYTCTKNKRDLDFIVQSYLNGTLQQQSGDNIVDFLNTPWTYLCKVVKMWPPKDVHLLKIRAYISTLVSRLEHNNGTQWSLIVKVNDGSAVMDVDLGDEMLTKLIGFSAADCMRMRVAAKQDKQMRSRITNGIGQCQQYLIGLCDILEMELSPYRPRPYVLQHFRVTERDIAALKDRVLRC